MTQYFIGVVGSRDFSDYQKLESYLLDFFSDIMRFPEDYVIVSGGADGADMLAKKFADEHGLDYVEFAVSNADWKKYGKAAGPRRNTKVVNKSDIVVAFWDGRSRGTKNTIDQTVGGCKPVIIIGF
jgi:hypothetical protein